MSTSTLPEKDGSIHVEPVITSDRSETQAFNMIRRNPLALSGDSLALTIDNLNQLLADTLTIADLYKKHHWQVTGSNSYGLHLMFDKFAEKQTEIADLVAERVQTLGGICIAMPADVAEITMIPRAPKGREDSGTQIARLLHAHEVILMESRSMARVCSVAGDLGTNDIIVTEVIRSNELQVWFLSNQVR